MSVNNANIVVPNPVMRYDIADYLIKEKSGEAILQSMCQKNPSLKKMIALLNLELIDFHFDNK